MEMNVTQTTATATPATGKSGSGTGKAEGEAGQFQQMLKELGLTETTVEDLANNDDLLAMLAALSGGLSPLALTQLVQAEGTADSDPQAGLVVQLMLGDQRIALDLQKLPLNNEQLANLLQSFGASPALVSVLMENPQGKPAAVLQNQPELLSNLSQTFTEALQQAAKPGMNLPNEQMNALMQTVMSQVQESGMAGTVKANGKQNLLNKMHVSLSSHSLQVTTVGEQETAQGDQTIVSGLHLPHLSTATVRPTVTKETTVTMRADQLRTDLSGLIVKRAAIIEAPGRQEFRIVLEPQGLGELQLRVQKAQNGHISVHIAADSMAAKAMIDSGLASLRLQLQAQGIQFDRIEVSHGGQETGSGLPQDRGSNHNPQGQTGSERGDRQVGQDTFSLEAELAEQEKALAIDDSGIDVTA